MSRAHGRHTPRKPVLQEIDPDSPMGHQLGMSTRTQGIPSPIPGGREHIANAPAVRQQIPIPDSKPEITDLNAHGVPHGSATSRERAEIERGPNTVHQRTPTAPAPPVERPTPIPVYVVEDARPEVLRSASPHRIQLQASTGEPVRLCGRDRTRKSVQLLNESTSSNIRFAYRPSDLNGGGGALLPLSSNSYLKIDTQDELHAISADAGTPLISIIQVFERSMD